MTKPTVRKMSSNHTVIKLRPNKRVREKDGDHLSNEQAPTGIQGRKAIPKSGTKSPEVRKHAAKVRTSVSVAKSKADENNWMD